MKYNLSQTIIINAYSRAKGITITRIDIYETEEDQPQAPPTFYDYLDSLHLEEIAIALMTQDNAPQPQNNKPFANAQSAAQKQLTRKQQIFVKHLIV
jgi:hypothetical protein